jgi:hypothetical protein
MPLLPKGARDRGARREAGARGRRHRDRARRRGRARDGGLWGLDRHALLRHRRIHGTDEAKRLILDADETATVHTRVFDLVQNIPWPEEFPGKGDPQLLLRPLARPGGQLEEQRASVSSEFEAARGDYAEDFVYAGQAAGLVGDIPAAENWWAA